MTRRYRSSASAMSFFSFQDIIACTTGIMIIVTLMLVLELVVRTPPLPPSNVEREITVRKDELCRRRDELKRSIAEQAAEIERRRKAPDVTQAEFERALRLANTQERAVAEARAHLAQLNDEKQELTQHGKELEIELDSLEQAQRQTAEKLKNTPPVRAFQPDRFFEGEVFVVELSDSGVCVGYYEPQKGNIEPHKTFATAEYFLSWAKAQRPGRVCFLLRVAPGGAQAWEHASGELRKANHLIGHEPMSASDSLMASDRRGAADRNTRRR